MDYSFFINWSADELREQERKTRQKIESLEKMLRLVPSSIFLQQQINQQRNKLKQILENKNYE